MYFKYSKIFDEQRMEINIISNKSILSLTYLHYEIFQVSAIITFLMEWKYEFEDVFQAETLFRLV